MKIFLSWSGEASKQVASALHDWIPLILHYCKPWLSERDISAGGRWAIELGKNLEQISFGIVCLTRDNLTAPWILFETGALSKSLAEAALLPYLFRLELSDLSGPLSQFQAKKAEKSHTFDMLQAINNQAETKIEPERLQRLFDALWPNLDERIGAIVSGDVKETGPIRPKEQVYEELVASVKMMYRRVSELEDSLTARLELIQASGADKDADVIRLDALKAVIKQAEELIGSEPQTPENIRTARAMSEHCQQQIASLFTTYILSEGARERAKRLLGRAEAIIALCEKQMSEKPSELPLQKVAGEDSPVGARSEKSRTQPRKTPQS